MTSSYRDKFEQLSRHARSLLRRLDLLKALLEDGDRSLLVQIEDMECAIRAVRARLDALRLHSGR